MRRAFTLLSLSLMLGCGRVDTVIGGVAEPGAGAGPTANGGAGGASCIVPSFQAPLPSSLLRLDPASAPLPRALQHGGATAHIKDVWNFDEPLENWRAETGSYSASSAEFPRTRFLCNPAL